MNDTTTNEITYRHRGVKITFNAERAYFSALVNGKRATTPSLDAMKKRIDDMVSYGFIQFDALIEYEGYSAKRIPQEQWAAQCSVLPKSSSAYDPTLRILRSVKIVAFDRKESRYVDEEGQQHWSVIEDKPGAIEAWRDYWEAHNRQTERERQLQAEVNEMKAKIPYRVHSAEAKKDVAS